MSFPILMNISTNTPSISLQNSPTKDPNYWNSVLKHHAKLKNDQAILKLYTETRALGISPTKLRPTLPLVIKACARLQDVSLGQKIHSDVICTQLVTDVRIRTALIDFYCKCGLMDDAHDLFGEMAERDLVSWNAMISGCVGNNHYDDAIELFVRMRREGFEPSSVTLVSLLSACAELIEYRLGKGIHCYCLRRGFVESEPHVGTSLIGFYSRFSNKSSRNVFDLMTLKNTVSWNSIMYAYFETGNVAEVVNLFSQMLEGNVAPDSVSLLVVLQSCAECQCLELGKQVHQFAVKYGYTSDMFIANALIDMYGKCGNSESLCVVFEGMIVKDLASWNAMMSAYKNCMLYDKALNLFKRMKLESVKENVVSIASAISVCAESDNYDEGKQLHAYAIKTREKGNVTLDHALLNMYVEFNCMVSSLEIFCRMDKSDAVSWNIMIAGLIRNGLTWQAWDIFREMLQSTTKPNSYTMVSLLGGCKDNLSVNIGRSIHGYIIRHSFDVDATLCTSLIDMYMDCGCESAGLHIFWNSSRDIISWNAMMASYNRNGKPNEALPLFHRMHSEVSPNSATLLNVLSSCAQMGNLQQGRFLHGYIVRKDLTSDTPLANALLTMYAKCGSISNAEKIFENILMKDTISWSAMIAAHGIHGRGEDALSVFYKMLGTGRRPTGVTFVSLLFACSHSGLVEKGMELFYAMARDYDITPEAIHYACIVDLLARSGRLDSATDLIRSLPVEPAISIWRALLSACRVSPNTELARTVAEKLIELEPLNISNYILPSNIYAAAGCWEDVKKLRMQIEEMGLEKDPGNSWLFIDNQVHSFTAGS
ncbi:putative pentatricopeptide repeat-containing protein At3g01580 isoform X1 [Typha latifolia]|uniref:putative pentatricopeptide repeat-containing protein At3g01580 isoform X1 n=1 Tax=Typha latifolia TaxID=4733 RepID=UPI003C2EA002